MPRENLSPLRYPGGKAFLVNFLSEIIEYNQPLDTYIEPFVGGAGAALGLLFSNKVKKIIINDADKLIYSFWYTLLNNPKYLIKMIEETPVNIQTYLKIKKQVFNENGEDGNINNMGFNVIYLNRCNRSGILKSGPIGGYSQNTQWKIDCRFNKEGLIKKIDEIAKHNDKIQIYNEDAIIFLKELELIRDYNPVKSIIYLDPPYFKQGPTLYRKYYNEMQHEELRDYLMNGIKSKWILSYDDVEEINQLYTDSIKKGYNKSHFAYKAKIGKELIIFSDNCKIPNDIKKI